MRYLNEFNGSNFCVIIPTLNRTNDLIQTLKSVCESSIKPNRIIIVDDGDIEKTRKNIKEIITSNPAIKFKIIWGKSTGTANAKNIGIEYIDDSDIVFFLDDDVTLSKEYFNKIMITFDNSMEIMGCQGFISNSINRNVLFRFIIGLMGIIIPIKRSFFTPDVTKSMVNRYPLFVPIFKKVRYCHWLSGCNMAYRAEMLNKFKFDENLIAISLGEDFEFSYRLLKNGFKLAINYEARLIHRYSNEYRRAKKAMLMMEFGYQFYYIYKFVLNRKFALFLCRYHSLILLLFLIFNSLIQIRLDILTDGLDAYQRVKIFENDISHGNISTLNNEIKKLL